MKVTKSTIKSNFRLTGSVLACCLSLALSLPVFDLIALPAQAAIGADVRLGQLETKFFKHTYPKDEEAVRLERLEKMIFGESRTGTSEDRLKNLAATVPNLAESTEAAAAPAASEGGGGKAQRSTRNVNNADSDLDLTEERTKSNRPGGQVLSGESKYPAVTALEQNLFKRDYASEPVGDRLNRLESKVFGKPSKFTDMSERVDALKEKTNIDIAKKAPPGTDWVDEEDDDVSFPGPRAKAGGTTPFTKNDGYGRTNSGGGYGTSGTSSSSGAASGAYGVGSGSASGSASGAYGMGGMSSASTFGTSMPSAAPRRPLKPAGKSSDRFDDDEPSAPAVGAIGLSSQVTALENAVLGKTFSQDPLINRVGRLEETVFPNKTDSAAAMSLPERVSKLVAKVPVAAAPPKSARAKRSLDMDMDDDIDMGSGSGLSSLMGGSGALNNSLGSGMTMSQSTQTRGSGGLGRIINSIGNMLGGGYVGSYGMAGGGSMVRDPGTGMLVDTLSGNLINPSTGQIVGRSTGYPSQVYTNGITQYGGGYGTGIGGMPMGMGGGYGYPNAMQGIPPLGGYTGFNNGFSPYGYPAGGYGMNNGMGGMGSGIRFGGSNFGVRF